MEVVAPETDDGTCWNDQGIAWFITGISYEIVGSLLPEVLGQGVLVPPREWGSRKTGPFSSLTSSSVIQQVRYGLCFVIGSPFSTSPESWCQANFIPF